MSVTSERCADKMLLPKNQRGAALMLLLLVIIVGGLAFYLSVVDPLKYQNRRQRSTQQALAEAKRSLIGFALTSYRNDAERYGFLPCPDLNTFGSEGAMDNGPTHCGQTNITKIGRLPWYSLLMDLTTDENSECLWYVVSGNYKRANKGALLNQDTPGMLQVFASDGATMLLGATPADRPVAAVISVGRPMAGQQRYAEPGGRTPVCGGNYDAANYLESVGGINNADENAAVNQIHRIVSGSTQNLAINDVVLPIYRQEIFDVLVNSQQFTLAINGLMNDIAACLVRFGNAHVNNALPWAAPIAMTAVDDYASNSKYDDENSRYFGRLPYQINDSGSGLLALLEDSNCGVGGVSEANKQLYDDWKDHFFYIVAHAKAPPVPVNCTAANCLQYQDDAALRNYSAVLLFAGPRHANVAPRIAGAPDAGDGKADIMQYLESANFSNYNGGDYSASLFGNVPALPGVPGDAARVYNDMAICIEYDSVNSVYLSVPNCGVP